MSSITFPKQLSVSRVLPYLEKTNKDPTKGMSALKRPGLPCFFRSRDGPCPPDHAIFRNSCVSHSTADFVFSIASTDSLKIWGHDKVFVHDGRTSLIDQGLCGDRTGNSCFRRGAQISLHMGFRGLSNGSSSENVGTILLFYCDVFPGQLSMIP